MEKLDDLVGMTLALGPFVKIGIRDLTPSASIHTTVALYQPTQGSKPPPISKTIEGGDGTLLLVPVVSANVEWRRIIVNGNAQAANANANASSSQMQNPASVAGYDAKTCSYEQPYKVMRLPLTWPTRTKTNQVLRILASEALIQATRRSQIL